MRKVVTQETTRVMNNASNHRMRLTWSRVWGCIFFIASSVATVACGQKGGLYLPSKAASPTPVKTNRTDVAQMKVHSAFSDMHPKTLPVSVK